jgi:hypothetical protein
MADDSGIDTHLKQIIFIFIVLVLIFVAQGITLMAQMEMQPTYFNDKFGTDIPSNIFGIMSFVLGFATLQEMGIPEPFNFIPLIFLIVMYIYLVYLIFSWVNDIGQELPILSWLYQ